MYGMTDNAYNRFVNLDGIEDRVIYYLISENNKTPKQLEHVHNIWRILTYTDMDALNQPLPTQEQVNNLIDNGVIGNERINKRIFKTPFLDDTWTIQCSMLKIYIDAVNPINNKIAEVDVGIDIITHNQIPLINVSDEDDSTIIDVVEGVPIRVQTKSRVDALLKSVLYLLNGADIAGIGKMQFNSDLSIYNKARYCIWNNRNYGGFKTAIGCQISGVE